MNKQELTANERERYRRQMGIEGWGIDVQQRLKAATVGIAGTGGLGSAVALYLASAGVGTILLCDSGRIELSNLNRQILYSQDKIGSMKTAVAGKRLLELNPEIHVEASGQRITDQSVASIFGECELLIDCLDNYESRYVLNRFAVAGRRSFVHAAIQEYYGQMLSIKSPQTACLECFFPREEGVTGPDEGSRETESSCEETRSIRRDTVTVPVCGPVAGVVGSLQAMEALKILGGIEGTHFGEFVSIDLRDLSLERITLQKDPSCPVCG